jgi:hypothetical protein
MNAAERLAIWERILERATNRKANVPVDYPAAAASLQARIAAGAQESIDTARGFIKYYNEKLAQAA